MSNPSEFLDENGKWACTLCGACCLALHLFPENALLTSYDRGDGGCKHLTSRMRCRIYDERPVACHASQTASELEKAQACAGLKTIMDREIELGKRSPTAKKWRIEPSCQTPKKGA